jgi:hypothetical protein
MGVLKSTSHISLIISSQRFFGSNESLFTSFTSRNVLNSNHIAFLVSISLFKMGQSPMIHIRSLYNFSSILVLLGCKNWRNLLAGPILVASPSLEIWGLEPSKSILRHKMTFFMSKNCEHSFHPLEAILHTKTFLMV